jgi:molybdopterin-guanine dinucleotide biosynthesis protein B
MRVIGFAGWSGSGKTTLIVKLIPALIARGISVSTLKHAHHSLEIDKPGKDSYLHREAGAREVLVASRNRWALMHELREQDEPSLADLLPKLSDADLVIVEGFKRASHAKIEVHRAELGKPLLFSDDRNIVAIVSDTPPSSADTRSAIRDPKSARALLDPGSGSAALHVSGAVGEMLPFASLNDVEAVGDLVMRSAVPIEDVLRRLRSATG